MEEFIAFVTSPGMITSYVVIIAAFILWIVLRRILHKYMASCKERDSDDNRRERFSKTLYVATKYLLLFLTVLIVLQVNGINVGTMAAGLGVASIVVGFALQDTLKDVIMGIHIVTDKFFTVGDVVRYGNVEGEVIAITPQTTKLRNINNDDVLSVSHRNLSEITICSTLVDIDLPLSYEEDVLRVHKVLAEICMRISDVDGIERCDYKGTQDFEDSAIIYKIRFFCPPKNKPEMRRAAIKTIQEGLDEAKITIPYNKLDVHVG